MQKKKKNFEKTLLKERISKEKVLKLKHSQSPLYIKQNVPYSESGKIATDSTDITTFSIVHQEELQKCISSLARNVTGKGEVEIKDK